MSPSARSRTVSSSSSSSSPLPVLDGRIRRLLNFYDDEEASKSSGGQHRICCWNKVAVAVGGSYSNQPTTAAADWGGMGVTAAEQSRASWQEQQIVLAPPFDKLAEKRWKKRLLEREMVNRRTPIKREAWANEKEHFYLGVKARTTKNGK